MRGNIFTQIGKSTQLIAEGTDTRKLVHCTTFTISESG